jgi:hypothetical protein
MHGEQSVEVSQQKCLQGKIPMCQVELTRLNCSTLSVTHTMRLAKSRS